VAVTGDGIEPHGHSSDEIETMIASLRERLAKTPSDVGSWVLLGRTLASLDRWAEAKDAFSQAISRSPDDPTLHVQMGEVLTLEAGNQVTEAARAEFAKAPDDPRARYYGALALAQSGKVGEARAKLEALAAEAPPDARWRQLVVDELQALPQ
jgi:cytochrome c-type biogenesis protein CcmH